MPAHHQHKHNSLEHLAQRLDTAASIGNQIPPSRQLLQVRGHITSLVSGLKIV
jgi:hypothetical protein